MPVYFHKEDVDFVLNKSALAKWWIKNVISSFKKKSGNINFIFCSDNYLLALNKKHLNHDYFTDVITFDLSENLETISGDIFISIERVKDNAGGNSFENELHRVIIHGVLHLLGYSDKTPAKQKQMRKLENQCLDALASMK
ncbi:MAG: rRNA maturation RNase YbeY [Chitinophagales bacterium]|nr:rRNA maturation RNase YbeY [Chitinophagales bacterium]